MLARCKNCGWPKKDHNRVGLKCPTRLKETKWEPWKKGEREALELRINMEEGTIGYNIRQLEHVIDWMVDEMWDGFSKINAITTLNVYCDRIEAQTKLADGWSWDN